MEACEKDKQSRGPRILVRLEEVVTGGEGLLRCYSVDPLMLLPAPFGSIWDGFCGCRQSIGVGRVGVEKVEMARGLYNQWAARNFHQVLQTLQLQRSMESVGSSSCVLNKNAYNKYQQVTSIIHLSLFSRSVSI